MAVEKSWLWNLKSTDAEARVILKDPADPRFLIYAARRLATANLPREVFRDYLGREVFLRHWFRIKREMNKDSRAKGRTIFWQGVYEYLIRELKAKGTPFVRPKTPVRIDPEQKRTGEALRERRRMKKMSQTELAEKTELTQQHIAKIEKGITCPRLATLKKIEKALGTSSHEYKTDETAALFGKVTEPDFRGGRPAELDRHPPQRSNPRAGSTLRHPDVWTWFTPDPGMRTESK
jgi:transcriptional regulator with XRE-family HTH domain